MSGDSKTKSPLTEEFGAFAKDVLDQWKVPGISIAVVDGDDVFSQVRSSAHLLIIRYPTR